MPEGLKLLFSRDQIEEAVRRLGAEISSDYRGRCPLLIGVLKGAFMFLADLLRHLSIPVEVDFVRLSSYGCRTETSGVVRMTKELESDIRGRDVIVVEDIVDTGLSLKFLLEELRAQGPSSLRVCALVDKRARREVEVRVDYVGFEIEEGFIVGYGIDYAERYRELPEIYVLEEGT
ncbi:MAG: hypoxanthine phosphoribosyltransferase [Deltaproteobacteria bacterium]|nr:MAG: hypoxanthine phosphoribosyltransferase [Deltaproteobacteria bacterium]